MKNFIHHDFGKLERTTFEDGSRLYKTPSGRAYPSITSVTGLHKKAEILAWRKRVGEEEANRISSRAATRGTRIHTLCENYLLGEHAEPDMFDAEAFNQLKPWLDEIDDIHCLETPLYSDHLEVAGTVDCIAKFRGRVQVLDFKTSRRAKTKDEIHNYFMQTAAYAVAFEERTGIPVGFMTILMSVDDDYPRIFTERRDDWIGGFKKLREEYRDWKNV